MKVFIFAGEPSGDLHASKLMQSLKEYNTDIKFFGVGGSLMEAQGLMSLIPLEQIAVVGFSEVLKRYGLFRRLLRRCKEVMIKEKVDCFIAVDYPGFNLRLASFAKKSGIPVYYYIAPQVWAWGKNRWKKIKEIVSELFVVFPFEVEFFAEKGIKTHFVGHPLLDNPTFDIDNVKEAEKCRDNNLVAFFPGSRKQEIKNNLALFVEVANEMQKKDPNLHFGFSVHSNIDRKVFEEYLHKCDFKFTFFDNPHELMLKARIGIVKIGTSTLEAALLNMNMIAVYKASLTHYIIGKRVINLPHIALPNIIAGKKIVPELIQQHANPVNIVAEVMNYITSEGLCLEQKNMYSQVRSVLTGKEKNNIADIIFNSKR